MIVRKKSKSKQAREVGVGKARKRVLSNLRETTPTGKQEVLPHPFISGLLAEAGKVGAATVEAVRPRETPVDRITKVHSVSTCGCCYYEHRDLKHWVLVIGHDRFTIPRELR